MKIKEKYEHQFIELLKEMKDELGADGLEVTIKSTRVSPRETENYSYQSGFASAVISKEVFDFSFKVTSLPNMQ